MPPPAGEGCARRDCVIRRSCWLSVSRSVGDKRIPGESRTSSSRAYMRAALIESATPAEASAIALCVTGTAARSALPNPAQVRVGGRISPSRDRVLFHMPTLVPHYDYACASGPQQFTFLLAFSQALLHRIMVEEQGGTEDQHSTTQDHGRRAGRDGRPTFDPRFIVVGPHPSLAIKRHR